MTNSFDLDALKEIWYDNEEINFKVRAKILQETFLQTKYLLSFSNYF